MNTLVIKKDAVVFVEGEGTTSVSLDSDKLTEDLYQDTENVIFDYVVSVLKRSNADQSAIDAVLKLKDDADLELVGRALAASTGKKLMGFPDIPGGAE